MTLFLGDGAMVSEAARSVFDSLRPVDFNRPGRDPHHNLTDPLEIAALVEGIKPTFLGGQSPCPEDLLREIAAVAERHGMHVRWSRGLLPYAEHLTLSTLAPLEREYYAYQLHQQLQADSEDPPVLWLYTDRAIEERIEDAECGRRSSAEVLGYPPCCVDHLMRVLSSKEAIKLDTYRQEYGATSLADFLALDRAGVGPSRAALKKLQAVDVQIVRELGESIVRFPFVHFTACESCRVTPGSPADTLHARMHALAVALDGPFARKIEDYAARYRKKHEKDFGPIHPRLLPR